MIYKCSLNSHSIIYNFYLTTFICHFLTPVYSQESQNTFGIQGSFVAGYYDGDVSHRSRGGDIAIGGGLLYKQKLYLGLGLGVGKMGVMGYPSREQYNYYPLYLDLKYYLPINNSMSLIAKLDFGTLLPGKDFPATYNNALLFSPQLGIKFNSKGIIKPFILFGYRGHREYYSARYVAYHSNFYIRLGIEI